MSKIKIACGNQVEPHSRTTSRLLHLLSSQHVTQGAKRKAMGVKLAGGESFSHSSDFLRAWPECVGNAEEELGIIVFATFHGPFASAEVFLEKLRGRGVGDGDGRLGRSSLGGTALTGRGDHGSQCRRADRLGQKIDSPEPHRRHGVGHAAVCRNNHYRSLVAERRQTTQGFHPIHGLHFEVEQNQVD